MSPSFNLIEEPWIPVVWADGRPDELGLRETLVKAHEIREIIDGSPTVTISLHRLLLAILHCVYKGPSSHVAWREIWKEGTFSAQNVEQYLSQVHDLFYLRHSSAPFYQVAGLKEKQAAWHAAGRGVGREELDVLPLSAIVQDWTCDTNKTIFDHSVDSVRITVHPSRAARLLVAAQNFHASGKGYTQLPVLSGASTLIRGSALFETLWLNAVNYNQEEPLPASKVDSPSWEQKMPDLPARQRSLDGYIDFLTWQSRFMELSWDADGVCGVRLCPGYALDVENLFDPLLPYKKTQSGWRPTALSRERGAWRDLHTLLIRAGDDHKPSGNVATMAERAERFSDLPLAISLDVIGYSRGDSASEIIAWRHERIPLPLAYLNNEDLALDAQVLIDSAEAGGAALGGALWILAERILAPNSDQANGRKPKKEDIQKLRDSFPSRRHFWSALEPLFYEDFERLPAAPDETIDSWRETVRRTAREALRVTTGSLDGSARSLKALVAAERKLNYELKKKLPTEVGIPEGVAGDA